ncbi:YesL family protein [Bacillus sp. OTU2372]|uniref:YesL family protein n=1 Tax=Bacillus sp. OTU2372 TaxID=3043858 RepID=UPI00313D629E
MNPWEGKTSIFLKTVTNIVILNFLWVICSLPVLTIGPSTAAMYGVIRKWHLYKDESVIRSFIHEYRLFFKQGFLVGNLWLFLGMLLLLDVYFFLQVPGTVKVVLIVVTVTTFILYMLTCAMLFPIMVHYQTKRLELIKQAFTFSIIDGKTTFAIILMWIGAGMVLFYAPLMVLVIVVPVSMISFRFSMLAFDKVGKLPRIQSRYIPFTTGSDPRSS